MKQHKGLEDILQEHFPSASMDVYELLNQLQEVYTSIYGKLSDSKEQRILDKKIRALEREKSRYYRSMTQASFLEGVERFRIDPSQPHYLREEFTYARPYQYKFDGKVHRVKSFRAMYVRLLKTLYRREKEKLVEVCLHPSMQGKSVPYFNENGKDMRVPREVAKGFYCEAGLNANAIRDNIVRVFRELGIAGSRFEVYFEKMNLPE